MYSILSFVEAVTRINTNEWIFLSCFLTCSIDTEFIFCRFAFIECFFFIILFVVSSRDSPERILPPGRESLFLKGRLFRVWRNTWFEFFGMAIRITAREDCFSER